MKVICILILLWLFMLVPAGAEVVTVSTSDSTVVFTNTQANSAWSPTALVYQRAEVAPVVLSLYRHGNDQVVLLSSVSVTASNIIWVPEARYLFEAGTALVVDSSIENFSVQLHRVAIDE
ncbi:MAG TPA: hypothetical protein PKA21_08955 [Kiritimatiellia bacterium]|nr:hypothetical protein [Kiritimatiellia bacterium]HMP35018.1 hypothetical protein [Kiritimatiellia bacterium]